MAGISHQYYISCIGNNQLLVLSLYVSWRFVASRPGPRAVGGGVAHQPRNDRANRRKSPGFTRRNARSMRFGSTPVGVTIPGLLMILSVM